MFKTPPQGGVFYWQEDNRAQEPVIHKLLALAVFNNYKLTPKKPGRYIVNSSLKSNNTACSDQKGKNRQPGLLLKCTNPNPTS